jgi:hypothetical protein
LDADEKRGREVAISVANYFKLREPFIARLSDQLEAKQLAPKDYWRSIFLQIGGNNLAFCYDLGAGWMDEEQRTVMGRCIALATSGRLAYGMNGPPRWVETNWSAWDLEEYVTALAIEGEDGFDPAISAAARRTLEGYLQWGINSNGTIFEPNGKNGGGFHYAMLTAIAMARRGENFFGHPHLRKLPTMLVQAVTPFGGISVDIGTWSCAPFNGAHFLVDFFPQDLRGDFLLRQSEPELALLDILKLEGQLRDQSKVNLHEIALLTPAHLLGPTPYSCVDWKGADDPRNTPGAAAAAAQRKQLGLPNDFVDSIHGLLQTRSGDDADALFMMFEARSDLSTIGHQQHSAGHFFLGANREMWGVKAGPKLGYSVDMNVVRIDGMGLSDVAYPPRVKFLGASTTADGALASTDITNAYNYGWVSPTQFQWTLPEAKSWKISVETNPDVVAFFRGTQDYKMRLWGTNYYRENWGPTLRVASANPVKSAMRTAGIVRGKHPYALVIDDTDKGDVKEHLYDWVMQVPSSVSLAEIALPPGNPVASALVKKTGSDDWRSPRLQPCANGTPALLVVPLDVPIASGPKLWNISQDAEQPIRLETKTYAGNNPGEVITHSRLFVSRRTDVLHSRIALIPFRIGEEIPKIHWDPERNQATLIWRDQQDTLAFASSGGSTHLVISREGKECLASPVSRP